jgi:hypothetical protein
MKILGDAKAIRRFAADSFNSAEAFYSVLMISLRHFEVHTPTKRPVNSVMSLI